MEVRETWINTFSCCLRRVCSADLGVWKTILDTVSVETYNLLTKIILILTASTDYSTTATILEWNPRCFLNGFREDAQSWFGLQYLTRVKLVWIVLTKKWILITNLKFYRSLCFQFLMHYREMSLLFRGKMHRLTGHWLLYRSFEKREICALDWSAGFPNLNFIESSWITMTWEVYSSGRQYDDVTSS